jgi:hypothetical protein
MLDIEVDLKDQFQYRQWKIGSRATYLVGNDRSLGGFCLLREEEDDSDEECKEHSQDRFVCHDV